MTGRRHRAGQPAAGRRRVVHRHPGQVLGHYVTAVLAARHAIKVRLQGSVVVGIAAMVDLPAALVTDGPAPARPEAQPALPAGDWASTAGRATGEFAAVPDEAGERPSPDDVHGAVALLRTRSTTPPTPAGGRGRDGRRDPGRALHDRAPPQAGPVGTGPHRGVRAVRDPPAPRRRPARAHASGLVRRIPRGPVVTPATATT